MTCATKTLVSLIVMALFSLLDNERLFGHSVKVYNPTIVEIKNQKWLVFRAENPGSYATSLAKIKLNDKLETEGRAEKLEVARIASHIQTIDDPRVFYFAGKAYISHVQGVETGSWNWATAVVISELTSKCKISPGPSSLVKYGSNVNFSSSSKYTPSREKNWIFFEHPDTGQLEFIYNFRPLTLAVVFNDTMAKTLASFDSAKDIPHFVSGGSNMVKWSDSEFVTAVHGFETINGQRRYFFQFLLYDFRLRRISKLGRDKFYSQVVKGTDLRFIYEPNSNYRPDVIYPCGLIKHNELLIVSFGWQDCSCGLGFFTADEIF